jgi:hypothetical protein
MNDANKFVLQRSDNFLAMCKFIKPLGEVKCGHNLYRFSFMQLFRFCFRRLYSRQNGKQETPYNKYNFQVN